MVQLPNPMEAHVLASAPSNAAVAAITGGGVTPNPPSPRGPALAGYLSNAGITNIPITTTIATSASSANATAGASTVAGEATIAPSTAGAAAAGSRSGTPGGGGLTSAMAAFLMAADVVNLSPPPVGQHRPKSNSISYNSPSPDHASLVAGGRSTPPLPTSGITSGTNSGLSSLTNGIGHLPRFLQRRPSSTQIAALQTLAALGSNPLAAEHATVHGAPRRLVPLHPISGSGHTRGLGSGGSGHSDITTHGHHVNSGDGRVSPVLAARERARSIAHSIHRPPSQHNASTSNVVNV
jgi:hypothetical protein